MVSIDYIFDPLVLSPALPPIDHFISALQHCRKSKHLSCANRAYSITCNHGMDSQTLVRNLLIPMFLECGNLHLAQQIFKRYPNWNEHTWASLIRVAVDQGDSEGAFMLYNQMEEQAVYPSRYTFLFLLKACRNQKNLERVQSLYAAIIREGLEGDSFLVSALVDMYGKCGLDMDAQDVFDSVTDHDVVCWTALITGYAQLGLTEKASRSLEQMQLSGVSPDIVLWNAVILANAEQGESDMSFKQYTQMQEQGLLPNPVTYLNILKACSNVEAIKVGLRIHAQIYMITRFCETALGTALINMYGKCGNMADAEKILQKWATKSVIAWNALITGYAHQGQFDFVFSSFEKMREEGVRPDTITLLIILNVCSHSGSLEKAQCYFWNMHTQYGLVPTIKHYNCMIDLLGRLGKLSEAVALMEKMLYPPNYVTWSNLLAACQKWGDVELCREGFQNAIKLKEKDARIFMLMSNIYADVQKWREGIETQGNKDF